MSADERDLDRYGPGDGDPDDQWPDDVLAEQRAWRQGRRRP